MALVWQPEVVLSKYAPEPKVDAAERRLEFKSVWSLSRLEFGKVRIFQVDLDAGQSREAFVQAGQ